MTEINLELGRTVVTGGVDRTMGTDPGFAQFVANCLTRHQRGDWGDIEPADAEMNRDALTNQSGRLMSTYPLPEPTRVTTNFGPQTETHLWVITDPGPTTTVLWPSEY